MQPVPSPRTVTLNVLTSKLYPRALIEDWFQRVQFSSRLIRVAIDTDFFPKGQFSVNDNIGIVKTFQLTETGLQAEVVFSETHSANIGYEATQREPVCLSPYWATDFDFVNSDFVDDDSTEPAWTVSCFELKWLLLCKASPETSTQS